YRIERLIDPRGLPTKYTRGIDYCVLLSWPLLGRALEGRDRRRGAIIAAILLVFAVLTVGDTARLASLLGGRAFVVATRRPGLMEPALCVLVVLMVAVLPFSGSVALAVRDMLAGTVKLSVLHRLEIWNYVCARIWERPLAGWGLGMSKLLPIS